MDNIADNTGNTVSKSGNRVGNKDNNININNINYFYNINYF